MPKPLIYHTTPPALLPLFARALFSRGSAAHDAPRTPDIPPLEAKLIGADTGGASLARYREVCGFACHRHIPATWPHILAFPLHLTLLTDKAFPLPLLGLVHLRNRITQHRAIGDGEPLDIRVRLGAAQPTDRGIEFDLLTEATAAGRVVWEETSTNLFRQPGNTNPADRKTPPPALVSMANRLPLAAPEDIGRRYAAVAGDRNPIHLHPLSAKAFGFPRAIAHGMWSQARILALLEAQAGWQGPAFTVDAQFKKPLFLPGQAELQWEADQDGWDYQLLNASGDAPHLTGRILWRT